ncbi:MAG: response regulator [Nevskia sp.]|nr:response regulator [Nevskia sp.]
MACALLLPAAAGAAAPATAQLSAEQRAWLERHPEVSFGVNDFPPIIFSDPDGRPAGVAVDYTQLVASRLGIKVRWIRYRTWADEIDALRAGAVDVAPSMANPETPAGLFAGEPWMFLKGVIFTRRAAGRAAGIDDFAGQVVAVQRISPGDMEMVQRYPKQRLLVTDTVPELLDAVVTGKAAAGVGMLAVVDYAIRNQGYGDSLKLVAPFGERDVPVKMLVGSGALPLSAILDRGIDTVSDTERQQILRRWFTTSVEPGLEPARVVRLALTVALPAIAGLAFMLYWALRLRREVRWRKAAQLQAAAQAQELERAKAELQQVLKRTSGQLQAFLDHAPTAMWAKDVEGRYLLANHGYRRLLELGDGPIVGERDEAFFPPAVADNFRREDEAVWRGRQTESLVQTVPRKDGREITVLVVKFPLLDDHGQAYAAAGVCVDISEQVALQEELRRLNRDLAQREQQLLRISQSPAVDAGNLGETYRLISSAACAGLDVQRASVWFWDDSRGALVCRLLFERDKGFSEEPVRLAAADFPRYFAALNEGRAILAHDAAADPRTAEFAQPYLQPLGITSMLDVAIRHGGSMIGVLCCEHTGAPRTWREEEAFFASALADVVGRAFTADSRARAQAELQDLLANLEQRVAQRTAEAQQARAAAETSRKRLLDIADNVPGVVYEFLRTADGGYCFPFVSNRIVELVGATREAVEADANAAFSAVLPEDLSQVLASIERSAAELSEWSHTWRVSVGSDGGIRWLNGRSTPTRVEGGVLWRGVMTDITAQKRLETELKQAQEGAESARRWVTGITNSMPGVVFEFIREPDGRYSAPFVSHGMEELVGLSAEAVVADVGRYFATVLAQDLPDYLAAIEQSGTLGGEVRHSFRIRHAASGETRWLSVHALPPSRVMGRTNWRGYVSDITEQKRLEHDLGDALERAKAAERAKGDFLANMSHEIRTPMNAIIGMAHLALQTELSARQHNYVTKIDAAAKSLLGIINDVLDFSKIEAGKLTLEKADFRLHELFDNLTTMVGQKAQQKGLELLFDIDPQIPDALIGDPVRLGQILVNLSSNAVKFTQAGEIVVSARLLGAAGDQRLIRFAVRDSGIGLGADQIARLFRPFEQADASTTRRYGGTGLGLTIAKRLSEMMGGSIGVESMPGAGSTFWFTARLGVSAVETDAPAPGIDGLRVLVVDDNPVARQILVSLAGSLRLQTAAVASGEEAVAALESAESPYDVVLTDWRMPGMSGAELLRTVKHDLKLRRQPLVILVTAYGSEDVSHDLGTLASDGLLTKPVGASVLLNTIQHALGRQGEALPPPRARTVAAVEMPRFEGARILLVEDNEVNREVAQEILQQTGASITLAGNGREAVDAVAPGRFDLVLMDMQMPVMDGEEATRILRGNPALRDLPIIAITANAMAGDRERFLAAGVNDHVSKPINVADLFATLKRWMRPAAGAGPAAGGDAPAGAVAGLPAVPGIDLAQGLERVNGNAALYLRVLKKFRDSQAGAMARIRTALERGDRDTATREAHSVAGAAGTVGATSLYEAAREVEAACRAGKPSAQIGLDAMGHALEAVLAALDRAFDGAEGASPRTAPAADREQIAARLRELKLRLDDYDATASDTLEDLRQLLGGGGRLDQIAVHLARYDFPSAAREAEALAREWGGAAAPAAA